VRRLSDSVSLGAAAVNVFPVLRHLPTWFPGTGFKRFAQESKVLTDQMLNVPIELVKNNMVRVNKLTFSL
jgi:hypothetical protein